MQNERATCWPTQYVTVGLPTVFILGSQVESLCAIKCLKGLGEKNRRSELKFNICFAVSINDRNQLERRMATFERRCEGTLRNVWSNELRFKTGRCFSRRAQPVDGAANLDDLVFRPLIAETSAVAAHHRSR